MTNQGTIPTAQAAYEAAKADLTAAFDRMNVALDREASRRALEAFRIVTEQASPAEQPAPATGKALTTDAELRRELKLAKVKALRGKYKENPIGNRHRRTPADIDRMATEILGHVKVYPGQRGEQIAAALKTTVATMRKPMKALIAAKKISTKGQRRGMTYSIRGRK